MPPIKIIDNSAINRSATIAITLFTRLLWTVLIVSAVRTKSPPKAPGKIRLNGFETIISRKYCQEDSCLDSSGCNHLQRMEAIQVWNKLTATRITTIESGILTMQSTTTPGSTRKNNTINESANNVSLNASASRFFIYRNMPAKRTLSFREI